MSVLLGRGCLKELKYRRVCPFCKTKLTKQFKRYNPEDDNEYVWEKDCPKCDFMIWKEDGTWWNATQLIDSRDFHFNEYRKDDYES